MELVVLCLRVASARCSTTHTHKHTFESITPVRLSVVCSWLSTTLSHNDLYGEHLPQPATASEPRVRSCPARPGSTRAINPYSRLDVDYSASHRNQQLTKPCSACLFTSDVHTQVCRSVGRPSRGGVESHCWVAAGRPALGWRRAVTVLRPDHDGNDVQKTSTLDHTWTSRRPRGWSE